MFLPKESVVIVALAPLLSCNVATSPVDPRDIVGVVIVGDVAKTADPVPVEVVSAASRLELDGVARNVATPVPNPETPVLIGSPVQLVSVPLAGVPSAPPL